MGIAVLALLAATGRIYCGSAFPIHPGASQARTVYDLGYIGTGAVEMAWQPSIYLELSS